jgi:hypothetical protein
MNITKETVKKWAKRTGLGIAALIVLFLIGFSIWLLSPLQQLPPWKLMPASSFAFFTVNLDPVDPGISALLEKFQETMTGEETGRLKSFAIKKLLPSFLPTRLTALISLEKSADEPRFVLIVSMKKVIRLLQLAGGPLDRALFGAKPTMKLRMKGQSFRSVQNPAGGMEPAAFTILGNNFLIGTDLSVLENSFSVYSLASHPEVEEHYLSGLLLQAALQRGGYLCADNSRGQLSRFFQIIQEKYSFAAFPSIEAVSSIMGELHFLPEEIEGTVTFYCNSKESLHEVRSDVKFIYGALRRVLKASDVDMKGNVRIESSSVRFEFRIMNLINAIQKGDET